MTKHYFIGHYQKANTKDILNLPRNISEYSDENLGEIISIPYYDITRKILSNK